MSAALEAKLVVHRGDFTLDASIRVEPGEVLALLGPNGSGKSTMLSAIAGLVTPESGMVTVGGRTLTNIAPEARSVSVTPEKRRVGLLGQDALLFPHLDARDNVAFGRRSGGAGHAASRRDADDWLAVVGLAGMGSRMPAGLSGGQQQRVAFARALAARPDVLLLDEPMAALDVQTASLMRRLLRDQLTQHGTPTLLVTHDVLDAIVLADRVAILHEGAIVDEGEKNRVLGQPRNRFAAALAGVNLVSGTAEPGGVRLVDGRRFAGRHAGDEARRSEPGPHSAGGQASAIFRPAAVRLSVTPPPADDGGAQHPVNRWRSAIDFLEPSSGGIACRLADDQGTGVELSPARVSELGLESGTEVWLSVDAADVTILPGP